MLTEQEMVMAFLIGVEKKGADIGGLKAITEATARKIAERLEGYGEEDQIGTGDRAYHFYAIQLPLNTWKQFIREGKGESE